jgi:hypothetical protein
VYIRFCAIIGKSAKETLAMIRQAVGEDSMSKSKLTQTEKGERGEEQIQEHAHAHAHSSYGIRSGKPNSQFSILL